MLGEYEILTAILIPFMICGFSCVFAPFWVLESLWRFAIVTGIVSVLLVGYLNGVAWGIGTAAYIAIALVAIRYLLIKPRVIENFKAKYPIVKEKVFGNPEGQG